jgi:Neurobeachin/BDCP, DUF4704 alpha solenoid region
VGELVEQKPVLFSELLSAGAIFDILRVHFSTVNSCSSTARTILLSFIPPLALRKALSLEEMRILLLYLTDASPHDPHLVDLCQLVLLLISEPVACSSSGISSTSTAEQHRMVDHLQQLDAEQVFIHLLSSEVSQVRAWSLRVLTLLCVGPRARRPLSAASLCWVQHSLQAFSLDRATYRALLEMATASPSTRALDSSLSSLLSPSRPCADRLLLACAPTPRRRNQPDTSAKSVKDAVPSLAEKTCTSRQEDSCVGLPEPRALIVLLELLSVRKDAHSAQLRWRVLRDLLRLLRSGGAPYIEQFLDTAHNQWQMWLFEIYVDQQDEVSRSCEMLLLRWCLCSACCLATLASVSSPALFFVRSFVSPAGPDIPKRSLSLRGLHPTAN